jgi:hypothetical protein
LRFLADGPSLPDELLVASDEGRVLFFCGAGASRAQAGLPDFLGLAKSVLRELPERPAQKLVDTAARLDPIAGVGGILAADRIFGLLEREFSVTDIERAVSSALKPKDKVNLSAHRTLLALSRDAPARQAEFKKVGVIKGATDQSSGGWRRSCKNPHTCRCTAPSLTSVPDIRPE